MRSVLDFDLWCVGRNCSHQVSKLGTDGARVQQVGETELLLKEVDAAANRGHISILWTQLRALLNFYVNEL